MHNTEYLSLWLLQSGLASCRLESWELNVWYVAQELLNLVDRDGILADAFISHGIFRH